MKIGVLDNKGSQIEELQLKKGIFDIKPNAKVVSQYLRVYAANQRQGTASTKTRGEVSGSGKKPWRQKGTGRARVGSIRNPAWRHGGISHGPKPKKWTLSMPAQMKRLAFLSALAYKFSKNQVKILSEAKLKTPKTKDILSLISNLKLEGKTVFIIPQKDEVFIKSARNVKKISVSSLNNINVYDVLNSDNVVIFKDALVGLQERLHNEAK